MKYSVLLCLLFSASAWAMDELNYVISLGSETHKFSAENEIYNLGDIATNYAERHIDRTFMAGLGETSLSSGASAKSLSLSIEKHTLAAYFSYAYMDEERLSETRYLKIDNPIGDQSFGSVNATTSLKAQSFQVGGYYIFNPHKKFNYGPSIGVKYWKKEDILSKKLTYETDDGTVVTQVGSVETITVSEKSRTKDSGLSPYLGGFVRLVFKHFQIGLDVKLYSETNYSYQVSTLEAGYRF